MCCRLPDDSSGSSATENSSSNSNSENNQSSNQNEYENQNNNHQENQNPTESGGTNGNNQNYVWSHECGVGMSPSNGNDFRIAGPSGMLPKYAWFCFFQIFL